MKRGVKLLILVGILVAAVAAVLIVKEKTKPEPLPYASDSGITIVAVDVTKLDRVAWTCGTEEFDFNYDGTSWTCNIQENYVPKTEIMARVLVELSDIRAKKVIEQPGSPEVYGLDQPVCTVNAGGYTIKFGDQSPVDYTYYVSIGDGKVYTVDISSYNAFNYTRKELVEFDAIPDMTKVTAVKAENASGVTELELMENSGRTYSDFYKWFIKDDSKMISQEVMDGILLYLQDLEWIECVDLEATDLAFYGLDQPATVLTVTADAQTLTVLIGKEAQDGTYAMVSGSSKVYLMDTTSAQVFGSINAQMLTCLDVLKVDWETVTSVELTMDGETTVFTAADDGWKTKDKSVDAQTVFDAINMMVADTGENLSASGKTVELKLVLHRNTDTFNKMTLTFYRHDGTNCIMQLDGNPLMLILRDDVVALKEAFNTIILG